MENKKKNKLLLKNKTQLHQRKRSKKSLSGEWWTPDKLYDFLTRRAKIKPKLDVNATFRNSKCIWYLGKKADATNPNTEFIIPKRRRVAVWCNPDNEHTQEMLYRNYMEWSLSNCKQEIMMIIPANVVSSQGFKYNVRIPIDFGENVQWREIEGRPEFLENGIKPDSSARNAYIVITWGIDDPFREAPLISRKRKKKLTTKNIQVIRE